MGRQSKMESNEETEETSDASSSDVETKASASSERSSSASSEKSTSASEDGEARPKVISAVNFAHMNDALVQTVNAQFDADGKTNDNKVGRSREGMAWHSDGSIVKSTPHSHGDIPAPERAV